MKVHIQALRRNTEVLERLQGDGWEVDASRQDSLSARHHAVANEAEARRRLHRLGLLTAAAIRVTFTAAVRQLHRGLPAVDGS
jgi:hypothetical protein